MQRRSLGVLALCAGCSGLIDVPEDPFVAEPEKPQRTHDNGSATESADAGRPPSNAADTRGPIQ